MIWCFRLPPQKTWKTWEKKMGDRPKKERWVPFGVFQETTSGLSHFCDVPAQDTLRKTSWMEPLLLIVQTQFLSKGKIQTKNCVWTSVAKSSTPSFWRSGHEGRRFLYSWTSCRLQQGNQYFFFSFYDNLLVHGNFSKWSSIGVKRFSY